MKKIWTIALLTTLALSGCSSDNDKDRQNGLASIRITIEGEPSRTPRMSGPLTPPPAIESLYTNFTVFIFNYNTGDLEAQESFEITGTNYTAQISNLSTGTEKRVIVYMNVPTNMTLTGITQLGQLRANSLELDTQYSPAVDTVGLFMSGEAGPITLLPSQTNQVTVQVKRRVAKVVLQSLIVQDGTTFSELAITGVSMQKARLTGTPMGPILSPGAATTNYAGGVASPASAAEQFTITRDYLLEGITGTLTAGDNIIPATELKYFYVLPNDNSALNPTLMTIVGTFGATPQPAYYPFIINGSANGTGGNTTDGTYITSNNIYLANVTITNFAEPSDDPNVIPAEEVLEVVVQPQDWDITFTQNVEW